ncbi:MAG: bifunctional folylpolyglutamate synthase/dihydrofolate synthase, partial [Chloroflexi bacterium]|nr:bifunctional folylpolyglutamate synthase/dihydrofolate synthase [Chloroflexota bacterium]
RLPGRVEIVRRQPLTVLDGLHTPLAARRFAEALKALPVPARRAWVVGVLAGKNIEGILEPLIGVGDDVFVAPVPSPRSADPADVARAARALGALPQRAGSIEEALTRATDLVGNTGAVIVVGSLYTVAAAREHLLGIAGDHALGLR